MNNHQPNKNGVAPYKKDYIKYNNHSNLFNRHYNNPPAIKVNNVKEKSWSVRNFLDSITKTVTDLGLFYIKGQLIDPHVLINPISHVHSFYASLRDEKEECKINIKMYDVLKLKKEFKFKDGDLVIIKSRPSIIKKRGELYLQIFDIELVGTGDLLKKIEELKIQLRNEGLFNLAHKKQLPLFPKKVGLITGKNSEGIKDVKINTLRRWPWIEFVIESVTVDGLNPPNEMYLALEKFEKDPTIEVIIFARGGGDPLGMLMFSDEKLVRSVFKCKKPVISAIGHEQDNPLLDYVADVRASTPTDVAKHLVPSWVDELGQIDSSNQLLNVLIKRIFNVNENEINKLMLRFGSPTIIFSNQEKEINESFHRILQIINQRVHNEEKHLIDLPKVCFDAINRNVHDEQIAVLQNISKLNAFINVINNESLKIDGMMQKINLMHPNNILKRGYALVSQNNKIISSINDLSVKQEMRIDLIDGHVISTIKSKGGKNG